MDALELVKQEQSLQSCFIVALAIEGASTTGLNIRAFA
jgi:hypothetical protein